MCENRCVVTTGWTYLHANVPQFNYKWLTVANECLNETTEAVGDIKRPHRDSSTH